MTHTLKVLVVPHSRRRGRPQRRVCAEGFGQNGQFGVSTRRLNMSEGDFSTRGPERTRISLLFVPFALGGEQRSKTRLEQKYDKQDNRPRCRDHTESAIPFVPDEVIKRDVPGRHTTPERPKKCSRNPNTTFDVHITPSHSKRRTVGYPVGDR